MTNRKSWPIALSVKITELLDDEKLKALADAGINQVELSIGWASDLQQYLDFRFHANEVLERTERFGIKITSLHLPFGPFQEIDPTRPAKKAEFITLQKQLLDAAKSIGIKIAVIHPSAEPYKDEERAECTECAIDTMSKLCTYANSLGIELALENLPRTCLCREKDEMLNFLDRIPALKACYDMNHCLRGDNLEFLRAVAPKLITIHVSDYDGIDERHWLPGKGINDWEAIISILEENDYAGRFLFELGGDKSTYADIRACYDKLILG
ncbi:MAG: sugar phosphate isomerase/epimerase [Kiritimatiellae bacterium]|nr:sugar phosphate isomerase/epimerase [Kiritimatiellia bacterium]